MQQAILEQQQQAQQAQMEAQLDLQIAAQMKEACQLHVLTIFPDIDLEYLARLCDEVTWEPDAAIDRILNDQDQERFYPKAPRGKLKRKRADEDEDPAENAAKKWNSEARRLERKDGVYLKASVQILQQFFPQFYMDDLRKVMEENNKLLYPAYLAMNKTVQEWDNNSPAFRTKKTTRPAFQTIDESTIKDRIQACHDPAEREALEEFVAARATQLKEANEARAKHHRERWEVENFERAQAEGNVNECGCCFVDYAMNRMVHCDGDVLHWFCRDCARTMAETQVGLSRHELACMSLEGCSASFAISQRDKFLDTNMRMALDRIEAEAALREAGIENLETCPFCPYAAEYPPIEENKEFRCLSADCGMVSCRACRKETHLPKTCEEAALEEGHSARHTIEEAMSAALIRKCNKCSTPFIKENGCNKMSCTKCRNLQCYICSESCDYSHFDDTKRGGKQGNCPLFDPQGIDARHLEEVKAAEEQAKKKVLEENEDIPADILEIKTSERVRQDEEKRKLGAQRPDAAARAGFRERLYAQIGWPVRGVAEHEPAPPPLIPQGDEDGDLYQGLRMADHEEVADLFQRHAPARNPALDVPVPVPPQNVPAIPNAPFRFHHPPVVNPDGGPAPQPHPMWALPLFDMFGRVPQAPFNDGGRDQIMDVAQPDARQRNLPRAPFANHLPNEIASQVPYRARGPAPPAPRNGPGPVNHMPPLGGGFEDLGLARLREIENLIRQRRDMIPQAGPPQPHTVHPQPPQLQNANQQRIPILRDQAEHMVQRRAALHQRAVIIERIAQLRQRHQAQARQAEIANIRNNPQAQQPAQQDGMRPPQQPADRVPQQYDVPAPAQSAGHERNPIDLSSPQAVIDLTSDDGDDEAEDDYDDDLAPPDQIDPDEVIDPDGFNFLNWR